MSYNIPRHTLKKMALDLLEDVLNQIEQAKEDEKTKDLGFILADYLRLLQKIEKMEQVHAKIKQQLLVIQQKNLQHAH